MFSMCKTFNLVCCLFFAVFLSCDEAEIAENVTLTLDYIIDEDDKDFEGLVLMNAFDESQVLRNYGNNITGIEIKSIACYLTYFTGPATQQINEGIIEVADPDGAGSAIIGSITNENLQNLLYQHKKITLQSEGKERLEKLILNDPHEFRLKLSGISNLAPNEYTLILDISLQMIAKPL